MNIEPETAIPETLAPEPVPGLEAAPAKPEILNLGPPRNGKIAKLAKDLRTLLNQMLSDGATSAVTGSGVRTTYFKCQHRPGLTNLAAGTDSVDRMARKLRVQYPGAMYHVMNRGDRREAIFVDDIDRRLFIETLGEACKKTDWQIHAWCLMSNHFHLVTETPRGKLVLTRVLTPPCSSRSVSPCGEPPR
jgi:transposase IS200 family protein